MDAISQMIFSSAFSCMKMYRFPLRFHWNLFPRTQFIIFYPALVEIMGWRHPGDKPLSQPMMISLPTHICVTRPQWVECPTCLINSLVPGRCGSKFRSVNSKHMMWIKFKSIFKWNHFQVNATKLHWWLVNTGSVYGLVSLGNKQLPEPMLTKFYATL